MVKSSSSYILILFLLFSITHVNAQELTAMASCCTGEAGRCTGSASCRVCTNCSRCQHCNNGGSCGVCAGSSRYEVPTTPRYYPPSRTRTPNPTTSSNSPINGSLAKATVTASAIYPPANQVNSENYLRLFQATSAIYLRRGPGYNYEILELLKDSQLVYFLAKKGEWFKVKVKTTETEGFLHTSQVKFATY